METTQIPNIVRLDVVDYGAQGEYDFFGKTVGKSNVEGMSPEQREAEKAELKKIFGDHVSILEVEEIPAVQS